jgi:dTDP-4-dehydrorhamnose reductase
MSPGAGSAYRDPSPLTCAFAASANGSTVIRSTVQDGHSPRPDLIINAAYRQSDWETTADGAAHVALAVVAAAAGLVHVSSDAVFSGASPAYDETRQPDPVTPYGAAKAAAETAVKGIAPPRPPSSPAPR